MAIATGSLSSVLLVGDSLVNGLARYHRVWSKYFEPLRALNFGVSGDRTQHVLWRIENDKIPLNLQVAFVYCGTNNLHCDNPAEIRNGIASIVYTIQEKKPNANFIVSGLLPRDQEISLRGDKTKLVNQELRKWCRSGKVRNMHYLKPDKDWTEPNGWLAERYYFTDFLHLVEEGYEKFANSIYEAIVKVSQGNVVGSGSEESENELKKAKEIENKEKDEKPVEDLVKDRKRSRSKSESTTLPPKTQQKQNGQTTSMTFTTTVLPKPILTTTLPPPTAIAPKLKIPPAVTSTLIPTIPPTTTSTLIMTTQPTATLPLTPTIPPTATLTQIPTIPPTTTLPHIQTRTLTLPPRALTTTLPRMTTIPSSLRPTTIPTPKHLPKCNRPINTLTRPATVSPKPK